MTMNELKPLVSDEQIRGYKGEATIVKMLNNVELSPRKVRDIYEAERAKRTHRITIAQAEFLARVAAANNITI